MYLFLLSKSQKKKRTLLLEFDLLLQKYMLKIEEKWSSLCNQVELTSNSDKAFAKLIVQLPFIVMKKDLTTISETTFNSRY